MPQAVTLPMLADRLQVAQEGINQIQRDLRAVTDQALDRRVTKLEDTVRWLTRTVAATLISAIGSIIVALVIAR